MEERSKGPDDWIGRRPVVRGERKVGTVQCTNLERRSEGKTACSRAQEIQLPPCAHLTRPSGRQLNAFRNPRYDSTRGTGAKQTRKDVRKKQQTDQTVGGRQAMRLAYRLWSSERFGPLVQLVRSSLNPPRILAKDHSRYDSTSKRGSKKKKKRRSDR